MNQFKTFKDVEDFLLDYNDDGTPIKNNTYICKSTKNSTRIYKHIKFKIFTFISILSILIFIHINYFNQYYKIISKDDL